MPAQSPLRAQRPPAFDLIETLRFEPGAGFVRLERHLARMAASAEALGFAFDKDAARDLLAFLGGEYATMLTPTPGPSPQGGGEKGADLPLRPRGGEPGRGESPSPLRGGVRGGGHLRDNAGGRISALDAPPSPLRVRLALKPDGSFDLATQPFAPLAPETVWRVALAETRLSSVDPLLRHKTSRRDAYDAARAEFPRETIDEVLLLNEKGEVCEGTITTLFVPASDGSVLTPPLSCGLLAGVLRGEFLESGAARESAITPDLLRSVPRFFVGNSLRGLIAARLVSGS